MMFQIKKKKQYLKLGLDCFVAAKIKTFEDF